MRWSYKTVHYELKKEGILGSAFLDESEVEMSLNEYGKAGWELVSMIETMDGLIAVFKQPLSMDSGSSYQQEPATEPTAAPESSLRQTRVVQDHSVEDDESLVHFDSDPEPQSEPVDSGDEYPLEPPILDEENVIVDILEEVEDEQAKEDKKSDIGSIRIE